MTRTLLLRGSQIAIALMAAVAGACGRGAPQSQRDTTGALTAPAPPSPADTEATLAWFARRVAAIERDTGTMQAVVKPLTPGAGSTGRLTAWRAGPVWRRIRVESEGAEFRTVDHYWLADGTFLGARLELLRPGKRPAVDEVWFRGAALYRWTDAEGRHLNAEARSTQYEVQMMRARLDSMLVVLTADDAVRR